MSFYRYQNVLCWSKFFEPAQKFIYILRQSQTFCARQKDDLHSAKLFFCATTNVFDEALKCSQIFGLAKKIWTGTKHFGTCKRTRHYYTSAPQLEPGYFCNSPENSVLGQTSISSKGTNFTSDFLNTIFVNGFKSGVKVIVDFD